MRLLALETSTEACSAALYCDGAVLERCEIAPRRHGELILPMVDDLLRQGGVARHTLDAVAFGRGPGAFTGVRIATALAQGLALGLNIPVVPISSLAALAEPALHAGHAGVIAALDARMGELYFGAYRRHAGTVMDAGPEQVGTPDNLLLPEGTSWYGVGSGFSVYGVLLSERLGMHLGGYDAACYPTAAAVARLGAQAFVSGAMVAAIEALPVYLRDRVV